MPKLELKVTRVFDETSASRKRIIVNVGGARSSKSHSVAQVLLLRFLSRKNYTLIVTRKTFPALRATAMHSMVSMLQAWGVYDRVNHNKSESTITLGSNIIRFISIEDPTRVRSMEANDIWMEEANEFTYDDYLTLKTRLSSPQCGSEPNQMFLTLNPSDSYGWVNQKLVVLSKAGGNDSGNVQVIYSSYKDNPFLDPEYVKDLEGLKAEDDTYYKIFALGVWAQSGSIIYNNYDIIPFSSFPQDFDERFVGLDFGFNNPSACIFVGIEDNEAYLKEIVYASHLTNADLITRVGQEIPPQYADSRFRADGAEPDRIEDFKRAGYDIEAAAKGAHSIRDGIDFCKRYKWHISDDSTNLIKEARGYKWREKNGIVLDEPVKFMDHAMDATRYAMTGMRAYSEPHSSWGGDIGGEPEWA